MGTRILVVDDDPEWTEAICDFLRAAGYEVAVAENGQSGLHLVTTFRPAVVVTDLEMPVMDGVELLGRVRAGAADLPVVVTTSNLEQARQLALEGAFGVIAKTARPEEVLALVGKATSCKTPRRRWRDRRVI